jgi:pyrimidine-nucleoside phosphorylase
VRDELPDEQMAAFFMAVYFRGLSVAETSALTDAMIASGVTVDFSSLGRIVVDKHSTGGVGDKVSIALGPVVAACGVPFAKISGRGLGHTGGTLDKLESIPGFRVGLTRDEFVAQVRELGLAIVGQTDDLVPADRRMYALRDVTGTVPEVSLIAASVMSKKIAAGADAILLDVKVGEGAFMRNLDDGRRLAEAMVELGRRSGRRVVCELTTMDQPLGQAVGNALEVREAVATLRGEGPPDLVELVIRSAATLLALSDLQIDQSAGRMRAEQAIASGDALGVYRRWVSAQGGDSDETSLPQATAMHVVEAPVAGHVRGLSALGIGRAVVALGAGRQRKEDSVDHAAGVRCLAKLGDEVGAGDPLAEIHASSPELAAAAAQDVLRCYEFAESPVEPPPLVLDVID